MCLLMEVHLLGVLVNSGAEVAPEFLPWHYSDCLPERVGNVRSQCAPAEAAERAFRAVLVLFLGIGCGGGDGSKGDSAAGPHTNGGGEQATEADLDAALKKSFEESDAPGVVAAVQTPQYTWVSALGVADRASGEPMTPEVHHRIGSVTKTFTATLLLKAADKGLLSLDDTIDQYVKGVRNGDKITLRQMADMTSGIASYTEDEQWVKEWSSDPTRVWTPEELARIGIKEPPCSILVPGGSTPTPTTFCLVWS
jgi:CubicO group peptidase (beta-lactamase class C family)